MFRDRTFRLVSAADFRHIALGRGPRQAERVFRAAISAFCALSRPTRKEVEQLDDLALGLFDEISAETRRFAAAALCECTPAPRGIVRRLAEEPVEIAAPLLLRSKALNDVDLIGLIARRGVGHARAISRRDDLNPVVAALIRALLARTDSDTDASSVAALSDQQMEQPDDALEAMRGNLRDLMREAKSNSSSAVAPSPAPAETDPYVGLREAALTGDMRRFAEGLGRALGLFAPRARSLVDAPTYSDLLAGLKALDLQPEQAFLLVAAAYPAQVAQPAAIRLFHVRYEALDAEAAREKIISWQRQDRKEQAGPLAAGHSLANAK